MILGSTAKGASFDFNVSGPNNESWFVAVVVLFLSCIIPNSLKMAVLVRIQYKESSGAFKSTATFLNYSMNVNILPMIYSLRLGLLIPALSFIAVVTLLVLLFTKPERPLPPSPSGHWLWGNMDSINQPYQHVALGAKYKDSLGDIISVKTPIETFIVVNTIELATELLEKQASSTANRPKNLMIRDLLGWSEGVAFRKHDEWHKRQRRLMASALHFTAARAYESQHLNSTLELLRRISRDQTSFQKHVDEIINNFMLRLTYGCTSTEDRSSTTIDQTSPYTVKGLAHYFLVNDFPFLNYFPHWFPGGSFQTFGKEGKESRTMYASGLFETVFEQVRAGRTQDASFISRLLETKEGVSGTDIELVKWTAASLFGGGSTTTVGLVLSFILMASLHPEAAKLAQAEIDTIIGRERLPGLKDRDKMPYTNALLQEVIRLCPPAPLGLPHITSEDIGLRGYRIPKNATISPNIWAVLRDPTHFSSPHTFNPSRYLKPMPDPDPRKYAFGFGRRVCPGQHVANNAAWIICTSILSVFELQAGPELLAKVEGLGGRSSPQMYKLFQPYFVYDPLPFPCNFTPRDQAALDLLANST